MLCSSGPGHEAILGFLRISTWRFFLISLKTELCLLRELLEESTIPYEIDVVEFNDVVEELKDAISKEGVVEWKN